VSAGALEHIQNSRQAVLPNQVAAFTRSEWMTLVLGRGLTGQTLALDQIGPWVAQHHDPQRLIWFTSYQAFWGRQLTHFRLPDHPLGEKRWVHDFYGGIGNAHYMLPGIPWFYILAGVGMIVAVFRRTPAQAVHLAWVPTILGGLYVTAMIGVTNGRFRFVYEPFFFIYVVFLGDWLLGLFRRGSTASEVDGTHPGPTKKSVQS